MKDATFCAPSCQLTQNITVSWSSWSKTTLFLNCSFPCLPVYNISCEVAGEWNGDWRGSRRACCLESRMRMWTNCRNSLCCCASFTSLLSSVLIHLLSPSFPCVQVPQILSPSALIIKSPPPTLSALQSHTHLENTAHWCNSCCLGGVMGDYEWDRSMWWFTHTQTFTHTCATSSSMRASYLPSPTEGHPAANEDTQTPLTISTTLA